MNFAKEADIDVIAEYVSSKEIYETVKSLGIKKFQGYYFSEPI
jgi:EAL domain-containing protein (putative c-di-GMP-specific phosphodiesterase class I)